MSDALHSTTQPVSPQEQPQGHPAPEDSREGTARHLVLGAMPRTASPATHLAAGPWCFVGEEDLFPHWQETFTFPPEPLQDNLPLLQQTAREAQALCVDMLPALAARLCPHSRQLPPVYWEVLLTPWAANVARQLLERWQRVQAMVQAWGHLPLHVAILPEQCRFTFQSEQDVTLHGALGLEFNHWLFSRLLETCWPEAWHKEVLPAIEVTYGETAASTSDNFRTALREKLRQAQLHLLFPRLKGLSVWQALRFSLALLHFSTGPDRSLSLSEHFSSAATGVQPSLPLEAMPLFMAALPESLKNLEHPQKITKAFFRPYIRVASVRAYEDAAYRQQLAIWRSRGHRLLYVQHGGNYGQVRVTCETALVEYSQHGFITWGWSEHKGNKGNFIPLPYPQIVRLTGRWQGKDGRHLLYVGTEMPAFAYRLDAHPTPLQMLTYREDKRRFFEALGRSLQSRSYYRPYFKVPGCLQDATWLLPHFPQVRLSTGPLTPQMLNCRLLILDHHGTTMLEALAAKTPTILFWRREHWPLTPECEVLLSVLERAGIWFDSPEAAAAKAREVWEDPTSWWKSSAVRNARRTFCALQALTVKGSENSQWIQTLKEL